MDLSPPFDLIPPLFRGLKFTLQLTLGGMVLCTLFALLAGLGRLATCRPLRWLSTTYVELFRGTSALIQFYWFYFVLPLFGFSVGAMTVGIGVLGLNAGAYGAEVVRGAVQSVAKGQAEAATALSFSPRQTLWRILMPQALVATLPPMTNIYIELMKNSALAGLITINELTFTAKTMQADTLRTGTILTLAMLMYFGVSQAISLGMRQLEFYLSRGRDLGGLR